jgi:hypothetical protein
MAVYDMSFTAPQPHQWANEPLAFVDLYSSSISRLETEYADLSKSLPILRFLLELLLLVPLLYPSLRADTAKYKPYA